MSGKTAAILLAVILLLGGCAASPAQTGEADPTGCVTTQSVQEQTQAAEPQTTQPGETTEETMGVSEETTQTPITEPTTQPEDSQTTAATQVDPDHGIDLPEHIWDE